MADKTTTLKTKTNDNVYPNIIGDNMDNAIADSPQIKHTLTAEHKINLRLDTNVNNLINNSLQKPTGLTKTKLVGVGTNGQENIEIGDNLTLANGKLSATGGSSGGEGGISVIELTDKNGTIASPQLGKINANPQNFAFKYNGKILLFTSSDSTTYKYCNNTTSSSDNNVMTTSTLLTITSSTGVYTIADNVHNVVANSIHPANGGDLTNIQVGSKVYSIPSGGGSHSWEVIKRLSAHIAAKEYSIGEKVDISDSGIVDLDGSELSVMIHEPAIFGVDGVLFAFTIAFDNDFSTKKVRAYVYCIKPGIVTHGRNYLLKIVANKQE